MASFIKHGIYSFIAAKKEIKEMSYYCLMLPKYEPAHRAPPATDCVAAEKQPFAVERNCDRGATMCDLLSSVRRRERLCSFGFRLNYRALASVRDRKELSGHLSIAPISGQRLCHDEQML